MIDYGVTVQAGLSGVAVINGRVSDDDATRLAVPLFVFVDTDREFLVEATLGIYRSAGTDPELTWFLNTDWSGALDVVGRWLRKRIT